MVAKQITNCVHVESSTSLREQRRWDNYLHLWQRSVHHLVEVMCTDDGHDSVLQKYTSKGHRKF
jgi:hypothetical protein